MKSDTARNTLKSQRCFTGTVKRRRLLLISNQSAFVSSFAPRNAAHCKGLPALSVHPTRKRRQFSFQVHITIDAHIQSSDMTDVFTDVCWIRFVYVLFPDRVGFIPRRTNNKLKNIFAIFHRIEQCGTYTFSEQ